MDKPYILGLTRPASVFGPPSPNGTAHHLYVVDKQGLECTGPGSIHWWFDSGGWAYSVTIGDQVINSWNVQYLAVFGFQLEQKG